MVYVRRFHVHYPLIRLARVDFEVLEGPVDRSLEHVFAELLKLLRGLVVVDASIGLGVPLLGVRVVGVDVAGALLDEVLALDQLVVGKVDGSVKI